MKLAQRWRNFKRPASSKGMWKQFVEDNQWPLVAQSVIPEEWDELSPKEDLYYQQGPFSTNEVFLGSKGGTPQLVQPGPGRQGYAGLEKFEIEKINNPSDEALTEIRKLVDDTDIRENTILNNKVKNLPKEITVEKLATKIQTPGYKRPTIAKELLKRISNEKNIKTYDNYRTEKIVTVLNDALTKNKGNTLYIKPSAAVELLPEFEVKNVKGGGGNSILKTYRNYIAGGERIGTRAGIPVPEEIAGRTRADIVADLDKNFLDVTGGRSVGKMKILEEIKLLDRLANENPDVSAAKLKELFEEAGGTNFKLRLGKIHPVKKGNLTKGDTGVLLKQAAEEGVISNSMPDSLRKAIKLYSVDLNQNRFFKQAEKYRKSNPELAYKYTKAMNLVSDTNMKKLGMVGAGEHALPLSAINTANAPEDTYFKIDAYVDHELNDWKSKHFDQPIFRKKGLAYKYNNADKLDLSAKQKLDIQEEIMQRLDFMKKRAPELMENVTFDFSGGKFTASSSTPSILDLDEKGFKALNEKGNRINQKFITEMPDAVKLTSTGTIASIDDKFIRPKFTPKISKFTPKISGGTALHSFPANLPEMWKRLGHGTKKILGWGTALLFEGAFLKWDYDNERSKGKTHDEAAAIAKNNASFGIIPNKKYLPELKKVAKDMGINPQAFEKVYFLNEQMAKVQKQDAQYQQRIEKLKGMEASPQRDEALANMEEVYANWQNDITPQIEKWSEDVAGQIAISKTKLPKPSLDQIAEERYNITDMDWLRPFAEIQMVGEEKLRREKERAYDVQSKLADPESGSEYKWITNWFTPSENFLDLRTTGQEKQRLIDDMLRFDPKELYRYNLYERGISPDSPVSKKARENLQYEHPGLGLGQAKGGRVSYLDGGIVSLLKK